MISTEVSLIFNQCAAAAERHDSIWEAKFIMDGISRKLIKDGIHSTIRVNFPRISEFLATILLVISRSADFVSC